MRKKQPDKRDVKKKAGEEGRKTPQEIRGRFEKQFTDSVKRNAERKIEGHKTKKESVWFGLSLFGIVGWSVALPTLIGVAVGVWLDSYFNGSYSWTLMFLAIGLVIGCLNAWYWVEKERGQIEEQKKAAQREEKEEEEKRKEKKTQ